MKFVFIVNPDAGKGNALDTVNRLVDGRANCKVIDTEIKDDTYEFIQEICADASYEDTCFVACGGDGTVNTVASAVLTAGNAAMSILPLGSGNDYVKAYGGKENFLDIDALMNGKPHPVDVIRVNNHYCVNAFHFGLDSAVANTMNLVKPKLIIGGRNAYATGVIKALICSMRTPCTIRVDGEPFHSGDMLLCTATCGEYVGGSYRCAPRTKVDDGLAEICLVKPVSRLRFLNLMNAYKLGEHLTDPRFSQVIQYRRGKVIEVEGAPGFMVSLDGEVFSGTHFRAEVLPRRLRFISAHAPNNGWSTEA
jgi:diacylglycerol kinase (ATP)